MPAIKSPRSSGAIFSLPSLYDALQHSSTVSYSDKSTATTTEPVVPRYSHVARTLSECGDEMEQADIATVVRWSGS